jgi:hypothetical protein
MVWPPTQTVPNAVRIVFIAGYGDEDTDVPEPIRSWMLTAIGALYENREVAGIGPTSSSIFEFRWLDGLLDNYRVHPME